MSTEPKTCGVCDKPLDPKTAVHGFGSKMYHPECVTMPDEPDICVVCHKPIVTGIRCAEPEGTATRPKGVYHFDCLPPTGVTEDAERLLFRAVDPEICGACRKPLDPKTAVCGYGHYRYHPECKANPPSRTERVFTTPERIRQACYKVADMLIAKNKSYGDSALKPTGIFAKGRASDLINARIDDKLNRIKNQPGAFGDNDVDDLIGYLILLKLAREDEAQAQVKESKP